jgi:peptide/nickel transport system substrate-binding protein
MIKSRQQRRRGGVALNRRALLKIAAATAAAGAASGLPGAELLAAPKRGGTVVLLIQPEVPTLATYLSTSSPASQAGTKFYDGLLDYDFDLKPRPSLAKSWTVSGDGKTITFELQESVTFHDGKPFTSADVKFSILEVLKKYHPRGAANFGEVEEIETPDAHTAIFKLRNPAPYLMKSLSNYEAPMLPKHLFEGTDIPRNEHANAPVGTGPYKFVEWKRGQYIRADRYKDYWNKGLPYLDRVVMRTIPDSATRTAVIEKGEVSIAGFGAVPYSDAVTLGKDKSLVVTRKGYEMLSPIAQIDFDTTRPPFNDVRVRQAVAYAIDRKFVIDNIWFGFGKPATGPISSNFKASGLYTDQVKSYNVPNGLEIADKLLDEAGHKRKADGTRFEVVHDITPYGEEWQRFGEYMAQRLEKLGIKLKLRYEDVATWLRRIYTDYDFQMTSNWLNTFADPVIGVHRMYHSRMIKKGTVFVNESRWHSDKTDALMDKATVEPDAKKRAELYHEFQRLVVEAVPITWVLEIQFPTIYNAKFSDLITGGLGILTNFDRAHLSA